MELLSSMVEAEAGRDAIVHVKGEVDISNVGELSVALREAEESKADRVIVDLTGTEFIDSSGISVLSRLQKRLDSEGRRSALVCPETNIEVHRILSIMGLGAAIPIHDTLDQATRS